MASSNWRNRNTRFRLWIDRLLSGTHNHYLCYLPEHIGSLSTFLLNRIFSEIKISNIEPLLLKQCKEDGIVVYATKYKSYFEYLFYYTYYKINNFPVPEIGFDYKAFLFQPASRFLKIIIAHIDFFAHNLAFPDPYKSGYIQDELVGGRSALLSLVEKEGFHRRFVRSKADPLRYLIELQKTIDRPVIIIPQLMLFSKKPEHASPTVSDMLFGTEEQPGKIRLLTTLFTNPGKIFAEVSEPVNLKNFLELPEIIGLSTINQSISLRRHLIALLNRHRQSITGPIRKSRDEIIQNILTNPQLQEIMITHSKKRDIPLYKVHKEANDYLDEIAADFNLKWVKLYDLILTWILKHIFEGMIVDHTGLSKVKKISHKGPMILVPCHKSHIDYLLLSYVFYHNNIPCPHIAAGKNLSFWPLGAIFRGGGAFFIRRTFSGAVLYTKVFSAYVKKLLEEGFNIELFFEGGRSRTGKPIMPQVGFLSILLNAYKNGACDDLIFVPIYIGYDQVLEESSYLHEIQGGQKKNESLMQVIKAGKFLNKRYGKIYLNFNTPISLNDDILKNNPPLAEMSSKDQNALCRELGYRILSAINSVTVVTPQAIVASAILAFSKNTFTYDHLMRHCETFMTYLSAQNAILADTFMDHNRAIENVLDNYMQRKFIVRIANGADGSANMLYIINEHKRSNMEYYKNNCIAFFVPAAFNALAILEQNAFLFSATDLHAGYSFLSDFFQNEFAKDIDQPIEYIVRKNIKIFIDDAILIPHPTLPDKYNLTSAGYKKLQLFAGFLKSYFISYWIVLKFFRHYVKDSLPPKERIKKIHALGIRMHKRNEIDRKEALSQVTFGNAEKYFISHGIKSSDDSEKIEYYLKAIQKYLNLLA